MRPARSRAPFTFAALTSLIVCTLAALPFAGCSFAAEDCELLRTCARCDPAVAEDPVADDCGFFVSRAAGDDLNSGSKGTPVRSLAQAVKLAGEQKSHVYACAEVFPEAIVLPAGMKIFGGLDCSRGWQNPGYTDKTTIAPDADVVPVTIEGGAGITRLQNVTVMASDARTLGASSIAVVARQGSTVEISRCDLVAGKGAPGKSGDVGGASGGEAMSGVAGNPGLAACIEGGPLGGAPVVSACAGGDSRSGKGGDGGSSFGQDGHPGALASTATGDGMGGLGESDDLSCSEGAAGATGLHGDAGQGGRGKGRLLAVGFEGEPGSEGRPGSHGRGGGGGGGSRSLDGCAFPLWEAGASGGSGGSGGCGGFGGLGGGPGGASIALISLFANVSLDAVNVTIARGGDGGAGGLAQLGGSGGPGGEGGSGDLANASGGCRGGSGGRGGDGGRGGGGLGGPSVGVAFMGQAPARAAVTFTKGAPGKGGVGDGKAGEGDPGIVGDFVSFDDAASSP